MEITRWRAKSRAIDRRVVARLLREARPTPSFPAILLAATTGMRRGEVSYCRKLVTVCSGGVLNLLDSVLESHSLDDFGEMI